MVTRIQFCVLMAAFSSVFQSSCVSSPSIRKVNTIVYPTGIQESTLEVSGVVVFKKRIDGSRELIHKYKNDPYNLNWWLSMAPDSCKIDTPLRWRLCLLEQKGGIRERIGLGKQTDVLSFSIQGGTVFDASLCDIHGLRMERVVETSDEFAGRRMPDSFYHVRASKFPNTGTVFPVCTYWQNSKVTWRCYKCFEISKSWCHKYASDVPWL